MHLLGQIASNPLEKVHAPLAQKYGVKLVVKKEGQEDLVIPMGARGGAAVYTDILPPMHLLRMVMIRAQSIMNYLVLKLH
jgi:hypothetical protein